LLCSRFDNCCSTLSRITSLQVSEQFHVAVKAGRTAGEVLADERIGRPGMLGQAGQFAIGNCDFSLV